MMMRMTSTGDEEGDDEGEDELRSPKGGK